MPEPVKVLTSRFDQSDGHTIEGYTRTGGWRALPQALEMDPKDVIQLVKDAGLRGRGGAGFPTGVKWGFVPTDGPKPVYLVINADEGEPGTFKDRELMERDPHSMLEGVAISGWALNSRRAFIFLRGEYLWPGMRIEQAIAEAYAERLARQGHPGQWLRLRRHAALRRRRLHLRRGDRAPGRARGPSRSAAPAPPLSRRSSGLYASPTVVNNVETFMNLPFIVERGVDWYRAMGTEKSPGPKVYCVSGEVKRPGNYEWPLGTTARQIVEESCGGMLDGRTLKFWAPGGSSTPLLTADHFDVGMDFDSRSARRAACSAPPR